MKQLKKYSNAWLKSYLEESSFDANLICERLDREQKYSEELLEAIVQQADVNEITHSSMSATALEVLRMVYNRVNGLTFEQGLEVEKEYRKTGFTE